MVTVPADRKQLNITDQLSLRLGLWLMLRAERSARRSRETLGHEDTVRLFEAQRAGFTRFTERENLALLTYDMQRHMI